MWTIDEWFEINEPKWNDYFSLQSINNLDQIM
jgi:hypothetical protein